ncbi:MAG: hypothetical protein WDZ37_05305 [Solirubrobacterales bacterium]
MQKWEARILGMIAVGVLSLALVQMSDAPPIVVLFGGVAGAMAGGTIWQTMRGGG